MDANIDILTYYWRSVLHTFISLVGMENFSFGLTRS